MTFHVRALIHICLEGSESGEEGTYINPVNMGGATSKQARKLPTTSQSPKWAGARTPHPNPLYPDRTQPPAATSSKSTAQSASKGAYDFNPSSGDLGNVGRGRSRGLEYGLADQGAEPGSTGKATSGFSGEKDDGKSYHRRRG